MFLQKIFWKLFPPLEVKFTKDAINAFLNDQSRYSREIILRDTLSLANNVEKVVYTIRIDGMKPDQLGLILITNVLANHLSSGQYHVYRGVLSIVGQDMLRLWNTAVSTLNDLGYYTDTEAKEDIAWINKQIKEVG